MVFYLNDRYKHILGHGHLLKYLKEFPRFHEAIKRFCMKRKIHHENDGTVWTSPGLSDIPWLVCAMRDCKNTICDVPLSGPAGNYEGAPRKVGAEEADRALYQRFIRNHAVKVETVNLPNGISTMYGAAIPTLDHLVEEE